MRRLLIILMMVVLPLQLSWAVAATYCQHESRPVASHFGHHVHKHLAKPGDGKSSTSPSKLLSDDDCTVCHLGSAGIVSMPSFFIPVAISSLDLTPDVVPLLTSTRPSRPERPKWMRAVL